MTAPLPQDKACRFVRHQMIERVRTAQLLMAVKSSCGGIARRILQQLLAEWERMRLLVQCRELLHDLKQEHPDFALFEQMHSRKQWWNTVCGLGVCVFCKLFLLRFPCRRPTLQTGIPSALGPHAWH